MYARAHLVEPYSAQTRLVEREKYVAGESFAMKHRSPNLSQARNYTKDVSKWDGVSRSSLESSSF